jgi:hypothetical protein
MSKVDLQKNGVRLFGDTSEFLIIEWNGEHIDYNKPYESTRDNIKNALWAFQLLQNKVKEVNKK